MENVVPRPATLSTVTSPPWRATSSLTKVSERMASRETELGVQVFGGRLIGGAVFSCELVLESWDDLPLEREVFSGRISFIDTRVDPLSQTCKVLAKCENRNRLLRAGLEARMEIQAINEQLKLELPEGEYETLSGFLLQQFGRIPEIRDELFFNTPTCSLKFTIRKATERHIETVLVEQLES